ncbi:MAG: hypothetical protein U1E17_01255 [Geminicoccaceae bacterium]
MAVDFRVTDVLKTDARRTGLHLGSIWDERQQGTNGGDGSRTERPVSIVQSDHFALNASLTCTVAPVRGPMGEILAVLDVSTPRASDYGRQRLILDVVLNSTRRIESRIFRTHFRAQGAMQVQLSSDQDFLDACEKA